MEVYESHSPHEGSKDFGVCEKHYCVLEPACALESAMEAAHCQNCATAHVAAQHLGKST